MARPKTEIPRCAHRTHGGTPFSTISQGNPSLAAARVAGFCLAVSCLLLTAAAAWCADWPQWRGPARNGISAETGWLAQWPSGGPRKVWSASAGEGDSPFAGGGGRLQQ